MYIVYELNVYSGDLTFSNRLWAGSEDADELTCKGRAINYVKDYYEDAEIKDEVSDPLLSIYSSWPITYEVISYQFFKTKQEVIDDLLLSCQGG